MNRLNQYFDRVVCVSQVECDAQFQLLQKRLAKTALNVDFQRIVAHPFPADIAQGLVQMGVASFDEASATQSFTQAREHFTPIKQALLQGVKRLFIFDQTSLPTAEFDAAAERIIDSLPQRWNVITLLSDGKMVAYALDRTGMEQYIAMQQKSLWAVEDLLQALGTMDQLCCITSHEPLMATLPPESIELTQIDIAHAEQVEMRVQSLATSPYRSFKYLDKPKGVLSRAATHLRRFTRWLRGKRVPTPGM